jgi:hypothetical protein
VLLPLPPLQRCQVATAPAPLSCRGSAPPPLLCTAPHVRRKTIDAPSCTARRARQGDTDIKSVIAQAFNGACATLSGRARAPCDRKVKNSPPHPIDHLHNRLTVTTATGDKDGDGDLDEVHVLGARSFSVWQVGWRLLRFLICMASRKRTPWIRACTV